MIILLKWGGFVVIGKRQISCGLNWYVVSVFKGRQKTLLSQDPLVAAWKCLLVLREAKEVLLALKGDQQTWFLLTQQWYRRETTPLLQGVGDLEIYSLSAFRDSMDITKIKKAQH